MWFGDLVTMRWWEGIWLNEAFATFMELLTTDALRARVWEFWTTSGSTGRRPFPPTAFASSRAIEYPVGRPEEAEDMFDVITYDKGGSVLRMIERHLGDDTFRRGLNFYLDKHRFANTVTTDLWTRSKSPPGQPVRATMGTWVNQAGHPVVSVELANGGTDPQLSQRRFLLDGGSDDATSWVVPVSLRYQTADGSVIHQQLLLEGASTTVNLKETPVWVLVNEGAWGVSVSVIATSCAGACSARSASSTTGNVLSLAADTWSAAVAGLAPLENPLELWSALGSDPPRRLVGLFRSARAPRADGWRTATSRCCTSSCGTWPEAPSRRRWVRPPPVGPRTHRPRPVCGPGWSRCWGPSGPMRGYGRGAPALRRALRPEARRCRPTLQRR